MEIRHYSYSYIKKVLGENTYEEFKNNAKFIVPIATIVLVVLLILSRFVHWEIVCDLLSIVLGFSLIFIAYILGVILLLDFGVDVELEEHLDGWFTLPKVLPAKYKITVVWAVTLIVLGIAAIYYSNRYKMHYAFECKTFLVDESRGIYHLLNGNEEENKRYTTKMKGYELEEYDYSFCKDCKEWLEDMDMEATAERYSRR